METALRIIVKRNDNVFVNLRYEPVDSIRKAARFTCMEDYNTFLTGHYAPKNPEIYSPQLLKITYEEVNDDVQEE